MDEVAKAADERSGNKEETLCSTEDSFTSLDLIPSSHKELVTVKCEPDLPMGVDDDDDDNKEGLEVAKRDDTSTSDEIPQEIPPLWIKEELETGDSGPEITNEEEESSDASFSGKPHPPMIIKGGGDLKDEVITGIDGSDGILCADKMRTLDCRTTQESTGDDADIVEKDPLCPLCSETYTCPQHRSKKEKENDEKSNQKKQFKCEYCSKVFGRRGNLNSHVRIHTGEKRYKCGVCERMFTHQATLKTHLVTHTGEKRFECQMCHKTFAHRGTLDGHILTHTGQRKFKCTLCSKEFCRRSHVKAHLLTHSGEKAFHCNICGKDFGRRGNLKVHMETHTGGRRFKCEICNKEFTQQGSLKAHMLIHSGEKNFRCIICHKEFIQQSTLTKHMLTHSGERRFACSLCSKAFTQKGTLNRHLMLHARMDSGSLDDVEFNELTSASNEDTLSTDAQPASPEELSNESKPVTLDETMSTE